MASGFVQRFKGKAKFGQVWTDQLYINGRAQYGAGAIQNLALISSSLGASTVSGTIVNLLSSASTTINIVKLPTPLFAGQDMLLNLSTGTVGLGYIILASSAGTNAVTFNGSSDTVMASTVTATPSIVSLTATSTANWAILSVYPDQTSTGAFVYTLSTSS
jgi:hypothetical protein